MKNLNIKGYTGQIKFDSNGDRMQPNNSDDIELFRVEKNGNQCSFQRL
ncbi:MULTISPECIES: hypothetical protein [Brasilonema]|nr:MULTISPECIES: hypothetical protein [Brasilonema]